MRPWNKKFRIGITLRPERPFSDHSHGLKTADIVAANALLLAGAYPKQTSSGIYFCTGPHHVAVLRFDEGLVAAGEK